MQKLNEKECIEVTDNKLVQIAIGKGSDGYYVQTTDIQTDTYLSEEIASRLKMRSHAVAIANLYAEQYGMKVIDWDNSTDSEAEQSIDILCPECFKGRLVENDDYSEAYCNGCGTEFILIGKNTVRYK